MRNWFRRRRPRPRADHVRIAELEHELFGIEPEPGTAAAFIIGLRRLNPRAAGEQQSQPQPDFVDIYANPALVGTEKRWL
ncbi:hypothetical protein [Streptomyces sp. NPDC019937]|uniref:hypothetical protein n=1 Tax=Streptomyces sp. NPDC019937 TaxID=3154787 RepID=UPI003404E133